MDEEKELKTSSKKKDGLSKTRELENQSKEQLVIFCLMLESKNEGIL